MKCRTGLTLRIGLAALLSLVGVLSPLGMRASPRAAEPAASDRRQALRLLPAERQAVRAEMRQMLTSVAGVVRAVSDGDPTGAEKAARASGMSTAVDPRLEKKLPKQFLEMGERTHHGFDELADAAKGGASKDALLARLANVMSNCVACHATYRFPDGR
jgi:cytochrome c556